MSTGNPNGNTNSNKLTFNRTYTEIVNANKVKHVYDYAYGRYIAWNNFFNELNRIQSAMINNNGVVELQTGQTADIHTVGGALAIQLYSQQIDAQKEAMDGLANLGLKNENRLWQLR